MYKKHQKNLKIAHSHYKEHMKIIILMINTAAPKATTRGIADNVGGRPADPLKQLTPVTPIFAESQKRTEPIQAGIDMGDGVGSSALLMKKTSVKTSDTLAPLLPFDTTGEIGILYQDALSRGD